MSIDLSKGQRISLAKPDASLITRVRMGLGWQVAPRKGFLQKLMGPREIDLDASALLYAGRQSIGVVYFGSLASDDGAVRHSGDNRRGGNGLGDDESISVDLGGLPSAVDQIVFTVNSFSGATFDEVGSAYCRLLDEATGTELARYTLAGGGHHTAQIMAKVFRTGAGWQMAAIGEPATGQTFQDLLPAIDRHL
ncbi:TerD family protein [Streptomyces sp. T-3]|nr:TerD family protein [Streptomyces sp. T-3]